MIFLFIVYGPDTMLNLRLGTDDLLTIDCDSLFTLVKLEGSNYWTMFVFLFVNGDFYSLGSFWRES